MSQNKEWSWRREDWLPVGKMEVGFAEYRPPLTTELAGKEFVLHYDMNEWVIKYVFHDANSLTWEILRGVDKGLSGKEAYEAIQITPQIYLVHFAQARIQSPRSVTIALDLNTMKATAVVGTLVQEGSGHRIKEDFLHAAVNPVFPNKPVIPHERTADLLGKRVKYTYSSIHTYEHIYLNDHLFTWHCLAGPEAGLADTENCNYFKIAPHVYLLAWWEKILPVHGVLLIDFEQMQTCGAFFGLDHETGRFSSFTMGAHGEVLNETPSQQAGGKCAGLSST